jgi:hypothetical protein
VRGVLRKVAEHSEHLVPVGLASLFGRRTPLKQCRFHVVADLDDVANFWIFLRPHHELLDISFNLPFRGRRGPSSLQRRPAPKTRFDYFRNDEMPPTLGHNILDCCREESKKDCIGKSHSPIITHLYIGQQVA